MLIDKKVAVIMGSDSDAEIVSGAIKTLETYGVQWEARVLSAHRTPELAAAFAGAAESNGFGVIIAAAGMSAHLAGVLAAHTVLPVIGIPIKASVLEGMDALLSTVMMPPGVPVATVGINCASNAALLALQILALSNASLLERLRENKSIMAKAVLEKDAQIEEKLQAFII